MPVLGSTTPRDGPVETFHRHDRYYLEDGVIFLVECLNQISVPRYVLVHESPVFEGMFRMPNYDRMEGTVDSAPIRLPQVEVSDFERLLEMLYPLEFSKFKVGTNNWGETEWKSILHLASMWQMSDLRCQAIVKLESCARPTTKILLGRNFDDLTHWILHGYLQLSLRENTMTMEDVKGLSLKEIVGIAEARERIRSEVIESSCKKIGKIASSGRLLNAYRTHYDFCMADIDDENIHDIMYEIFDIPDRIVPEPEYAIDEDDALYENGD